MIIEGTPDDGGDRGKLAYGINPDRSMPVSGTVTVDTSLLATSAAQATGNAALVSILAAVAPSTGGAAVSLGSDYTPAAPCRLWVGTGGDVKVDLANATGLTYKNVPSGTEMNILATKVYSTANGTSAADIITMPSP